MKTNKKEHKTTLTKQLALSLQWQHEYKVALDLGYYHDGGIDERDINKVFKEHRNFKKNGKCFTCDLIDRGLK